MAITGTTIDLAWTAATDNVGVTNYEVWMNGVLKVTLGNTLTHTVTGLTTATSYTFRLIAKDAAGNSSHPSNLITCTTL